MLADRTYWEHRWWERTGWIYRPSLLSLPRTLQEDDTEDNDLTEYTADVRQTHHTTIMSPVWV